MNSFVIVVASGSQTTLKNNQINGGYLHSHPHLYPKETGHTNQQVSIPQCIILELYPKETGHTNKLFWSCLTYSVNDCKLAIQIFTMLVNNGSKLHFWNTV